MSLGLHDCLSCNGQGKTFYLCEWRYIPCNPCKGSGKMERDPEWGVIGEALRRHRVDVLEMSMGELARKLGAGVVDLSDAERGRSDPAPLFEKAKLEKPWERPA